MKEQLLQLKELCDAGLVDAEVCKEKQRQILGLPTQAERGPRAALEDKQPPAGRGHGFLGLLVGSNPTGEGAVVTRVLEDGPAHRAGVQPGDVITAVGEQTVPGAERFVSLEAFLVPGDEATLKILRGEGTELLLAVAVIDDRDYPPARTYFSPFGFNLTLPAGWSVFRSADFAPIFDAFARRIKGDPQAANILSNVEQFTQGIEVYGSDYAHVSVTADHINLPATAEHGRETCSKSPRIGRGSPTNWA